MGVCGATVTIHGGMRGGMRAAGECTGQSSAARRKRDEIRSRHFPTAAVGTARTRRGRGDQGGAKTIRSCPLACTLLRRLRGLAVLVPTAKGSFQRTPFSGTTDNAERVKKRAEAEVSSRDRAMTRDATPVALFLAPRRSRGARLCKDDQARMTRTTKIGITKTMGVSSINHCAERFQCDFNPFPAPLRCLIGTTESARSIGVLLLSLPISHRLARARLLSAQSAPALAGAGHSSPSLSSLQADPLLSDVRQWSRGGQCAWRAGRRSHRWSGRQGRRGLRRGCSGRGRRGVPRSGVHRPRRRLDDHADVRRASRGSRRIRGAKKLRADHGGEEESERSGGGGGGGRGNSQHSARRSHSSASSGVVCPRRSGDECCRYPRRSSGASQTQGIDGRCTAKCEDRPGCCSIHSGSGGRRRRQRRLRWHTRRCCCCRRSYGRPPCEGPARSSKSRR